MNGNDEVEIMEKQKKKNNDDNKNWNNWNQTNNRIQTSLTANKNKHWADIIEKALSHYSGYLLDYRELRVKNKIFPSRHYVQTREVLFFLDFFLFIIPLFFFILFRSEHSHQFSPAPLSRSLAHSHAKLLLVQSL